MDHGSRSTDTSHATRPEENPADPSAVEVPLAPGCATSRSSEKRIAACDSDGLHTNGRAADARNAPSTRTTLARAAAAPAPAAGARGALADLQRLEARLRDVGAVLLAGRGACAPLPHRAARSGGELLVPAPPGWPPSDAGGALALPLTAAGVPRVPLAAAAARHATLRAPLKRLQRALEAALAEEDEARGGGAHSRPLGAALALYDQLRGVYKEADTQLRLLAAAAAP